jgi:sulfopyruvate decarboxylase TPP-binding subunit
LQAAQVHLGKEMQEVLTRLMLPHHKAHTRQAAVAVLALLDKQEFQQRNQALAAQA